MKLNQILAFAFFAISICLAGYLYYSINSTIEFKETIKSTEKEIIDKLSVIREAEKVFLEQNGRYTSNWDTLINFIETAQVPILQRREVIKQLSYGVDSVQVFIDTLGIVSAKDKIFKKTYSVNASSDGTFLGYFAKVGDYVVKGSRSYKMKREGVDKVDEFTFLDKGTVNSMRRLNPGDKVTKGQLLISFWDYQLNPDVDIKTLHKLPNSDKTFEIFTARIDRSGIKIWVIEVKDPAPINPDRRERNEAKNRKPLRFGSQHDVTTAGNWE